MPRQNNRSYSNTSNSNNRNNSGSNRGNRGSSSRGGNGGGKFSRANNYNMLNFGTAFLDETQNTSYEFKARLMLKTKDGEQVNVWDGDGKGENEYTPEEAAAILAKALLEGRAINVCFFANDDGSWGGNARIDINGIELDAEPEEKPAARKSTSKTSAKSKTASKRTYEVPPASDEEDDDTEDDEDDYEDEVAGDRLPY